ncbi:MAG TPA: WG repeat-containing protein [Pyrinomonadaceae bacterium]|nr:WG repeat-containing protein [Pyrinomonadaceae bacterium]
MIKHPTLRLALSLAALCVLAAAPASAQMYFKGPPTGVRNLFPVLIGVKWGYVDRSGKLVIEAKYDYAGEFAEGLAFVFVGRGLITEGLDEVKPRDNTMVIPNDPDGRRWEIIDESGNVVAKLKPSPHYRDAFFSEGLAVLDGGRDLYGYMDKSGKFVFGPRREEVPVSFRGGLALVHMAGGPAYIDREGNFVWRPSPPR